MLAVERGALLRQDENHDIEVLTEQALEASEKGDWDQVAVCYEKRGIGLQTAVIDRALARRLMGLDAQIRTSALVAQAAISSLLVENTRVKLQLRRLRESAGQLTSAGAMHREG